MTAWRESHFCQSRQAWPPWVRPSSLGTYKVPSDSCGGLWRCKFFNCFTAIRSAIPGRFRNTKVFTFAIVPTFTSCTGLTAFLLVAGPTRKSGAAGGAQEGARA